MVKNEKAIVSFSGGLDSTTLLNWAVLRHGKENVRAITFNYGSKHNHIEEVKSSQYAKEIGVSHKIARLGFNDWGFKSDLLKTGGVIPTGHYEQANMASTVVPFRNGIMLSILAGIADSSGASKIYLASHSGDHHIYKDCRFEFTQAMNLAVYLGTDNSVKVEAPFNHLTKAQILKQGLDMGIDYGKTWTCYKGEVKPCIEDLCGTCYERVEAFDINGVKDPLLNTREWGQAMKYINEHKVTK